MQSIQAQHLESWVKTYRAPYMPKDKRKSRAIAAISSFMTDLNKQVHSDRITPVLVYAAMFLGLAVVVAQTGIAWGW